MNERAHISFRRIPMSRLDQAHESLGGVCAPYFQRSPCLKDNVLFSCLLSLPETSAKNPRLILTLFMPVAGRWGLSTLARTPQPRCGPGGG